MSYGEIKKAVNSDLSKPLNTLIEEKTGAVNATGGTATAGGIFAKLNKLLTDWTTARAGKIDTIATDISALAAGKVVKSVQRGTIAGNGTTPTLTISIASVNPLKCAVLINGSPKSTSGGYSPTILNSITTNSLVLGHTTPGFNTDALYHTSWQVIEFY